VVECQLPKLDVAGSNPVSRSIFSITWELPKLVQVRSRRAETGAAPGGFYWLRIALTGSIQAALQAGAIHAITATIIAKAKTTMNVTGSTGRTP
jgi:hypothetical protein